MAGKKKSGKRSSKRRGLPKSLIKRHHGNLKAAWAEAKGKTHRKSPRKSGKTAKKHGGKKAKRASGKRHGGKSGSHRSSSRNNRSSRSTIIRTNRTQSIAVVPIPSPARHTAKHRGGKKKKSGGKSRSRAKEGYMMENPLGGGELLVGGVTAILGFVIYDGIDRVLATHALTDSGTKDSAGNEQYTDTPPTSGTYTGLYNATAVMAPMSGMRWAVGGISTLAFLGLGQVIKNNMGRSALQCFGFGIGIRFLGKALVDLVASLTMKTGWGQRLYDGEMRANSLSKGTAGYPLTSLPSTGLGNAQIGVGSCCGNCSAGLPCCRGASYSAPPPPPPGGSFPGGNQPQPQPNPPSNTQPPNDGGRTPGGGTGVQNPGGYVMGHSTGTPASVGTQGLGFRPRSGFIPPAPHIRAAAH